jgi:hypothetical protein
MSPDGAERYLNANSNLRLRQNIGDAVSLTRPTRQVHRIASPNGTYNTIYLLDRVVQLATFIFRKTLLIHSGNSSMRIGWSINTTFFKM